MKVRNALLIIVVAVVLAAGLGLGLARSGNPSASTVNAAGETDPYAGYSLYVEWDGGGCAITAVSGLEWTTQVNIQKIATKAGRAIELKIPGANSYTPMVIERGISDDTQFADWAKLVETGNMAEARKDISIVLFDSLYQEVARWSVVRCWPSAYTSWFDTTLVDDYGQSGPMEALTLVYEGFKRVTEQPQD